MGSHHSSPLLPSACKKQVRARARGRLCCSREVRTMHRRRFLLLALVAPFAGFFAWFHRIMPERVPRWNRGEVHPSLRHRYHMHPAQRRFHGIDSGVEVIGTESEGVITIEKIREARDLLERNGAGGPYHMIVGRKVVVQKELVDAFYRVPTQ